MIERALTVAVAMLLWSGAAMGAEPPPQHTPHPPAALEATSLTWCGDVVTPRADPALYRDAPVYIGNEMPTGTIRRWAKDQPGFVDIWIDRDRNGWITVMFTEGASERQADLEREFPGVGVVAVEVEHSKRELRQLARRLGSFAEERGLQLGVGQSGTDDVVELYADVVTEELARSLEAAFGGEPFCVAGADADDLVLPGPQPLSGDGWTMLGWTHNAGPAYEVGIATEPDGYQRIWEQAGLAGPPAPVDLETHVVVWFAQGHGSSCPNVRMDQVIVDREHAQVYPLLVDPDNATSCTDDLAGAYQFVAALERAELPAGPFEIGLGGDGPGGELFRGLWVDADLSLSGAVAADSDIGRRTQHPRSGTIQETVGSFLYLLDARCGIGYLGVVNDVHWITEEPMPDTWADAIRDDGQLLLRIRMRSDPQPDIRAQAKGATVRYRPASDLPPACEP